MSTQLKNRFNELFLKDFQVLESLIRDQIALTGEHQAVAETQRKVAEAYRSQNVKLTDEISMLHETIRNNSTTTNSVLERYKQLQRLYEIKITEFQQKDAQIQQLLQTQQDLQQQIKSLQTDCNNLKVAHSEEVQSYQKGINDLQQRLLNTNIVQLQCDTLRKQLQSSHHEISRLKGELDVLKSSQKTSNTASGQSFDHQRYANIPQDRPSHHPPDNRVNHPAPPATDSYKQRSVSTPSYQESHSDHRPPSVRDPNPPSGISTTQNAAGQINKPNPQPKPPPQPQDKKNSPLVQSSGAKNIPQRQRQRTNQRKRVTLPSIDDPFTSSSDDDIDIPSSYNRQQKRQRAEPSPLPPPRPDAGDHTNIIDTELISIRSSKSPRLLQRPTHNSNLRATITMDTSSPEQSLLDEYVIDSTAKDE